MREHQRTGEFRSGGTTLFASFTGMMLGISAIPFYTISAFAGPVTAETGWSMAEFQTAFSFILAGVLAGPLFGHWCDRYGPRRVALVSTALFGVALVGIGAAGSAGLFAFYAAWALMALVGQGTGPIVWTHVVTGWFERQRGLALGIALAGSGVFAVFGPALATAFIDAAGWQASYALLGGMVLLIALPICLLLLKNPPQMGRHQSAAEASKTVKAALRSYRFWIIAGAFFAISFGVSGLIANLIPMLEEAGRGRGEAARLAGLVGAAVIGGRIIVGLLLDRLWPPGVAALLLALPAASCLLLAGEVSGTGAALAVFLIGFAAGAEFDIVAFLAARYFGLAAYGKIYSLLYVALFVGAAVAPPIFGSVFDATGSYADALEVFVAVFLLAAVSLLTLGRAPRAVPT